MSMVVKLLEDGGDFVATRDGDVVSFSPASAREADLASFQALVRRLRGGEGDGYRILKEHTTSDYAEELVDLLMVTIERGRS